MTVAFRHLALCSRRLFYTKELHALYRSRENILGPVGQVVPLVTAQDCCCDKTRDSVHTGDLGQALVALLSLT